MQEPGSVTNVPVGQFADPRMSTNRDSRTFHQPAHKLHGGVSLLTAVFTFGKVFTFVYLWRVYTFGRVYAFRRVYAFGGYTFRYRGS